MRSLLFLTLMFFAVSCGYGDKKDSYDGGDDVKVTSWAQAKTYCIGCHGDSGVKPLPFMDSEAVFKANAKVRARVANGTMPKTGSQAAKGFPKSAFLAYLDN